MDPLLALLLPLGPFAFNPVLCGLLAAAFSIPVLLPFYRPKSRCYLAGAALVWWYFCWHEAVALSQDSGAARTDLVRLGPLFLAAAVVGAWHLASGHRHDRGDVRRSWRMQPRHSRRKP